MTLSRNFFAGVLGSVLTALIGFTVVPLYIKFLGIEAYGLIGFLISLQALFTLLDVGFTSALNREIARCNSVGKMYEARALLGTLTVFFIGMAVLIAILVGCLAPFIAHSWLRSSNLNPGIVANGVILMGLIIACRWPIALFQGALIGLQRLDITSLISVVMATISGLGGVAILVNISASIEALFMWQAVAAFLYASLLYLILRKKIGSVNLNLNIASLKQIWKFSVGMSGIGITGLVLMQLDKLIVSKLVDLTDFGKYALAGTMASGLYILMTPLFNVIYPKMSELVATENTKKLIIFYKDSAYLFMAVFAPVAVSAIMFTNDLLNVWTGNVTLSLAATPIVQFILIGTALNGLMHFPYALQLAFGATKLAILINIALIALMVPLTIFLTKSYGVVGGAMAWAILNVFYVLIGLIITHRFLLKGHGVNWFFKNAVLPSSISILVISIGRGLFASEISNSLFRIAISIVLSFISIIIIISISETSRNICNHKFIEVLKYFHIINK